MLSWGFLLSAIGLGLAYASAPGAVNTEALRRGVNSGARSAFFVEVGSLIGDSLWAILGLTGVALFAHALAVQVILGIAGGCFLLRMSWVALHAAWRHRATAPTAPPTTTRGDFSTGVVFGLANPVGLAFWSGLGTSVVATGVHGMAFALFFSGFFLGAVLWCFAITALLHGGRRWLSPQSFRWVNLLCGLFLGYFGVRVLWLTAQTWAEQHFAAFWMAGRRALFATK